LDGVKIWVSIADLIEQAQPPVHMSCDWLNDRLIFGIQIFRLEIYRQMEALQNVSPSS